MHLIFMRLVYCGNIKDWSRHEHGVPVGAVFGTNEKYPKAVHIVNGDALVQASPRVRCRELTPFGIPEDQIAKAFNATNQMLDGIYHGVDIETREYKEGYHGPKISDLEALPEVRAVGRTVDDVLFLNRYRDPAEILRASVRAAAIA